MAHNEERLALAVRAHVAMIRADQATEQAALLERRARVVSDAMDRFRRVYNREPDSNSPSDAELVTAWVVELGGGGSDQEVLLGAQAAHARAARLGAEAMDAIGELHAAMEEAGIETVGEWVGGDPEAFERAVDEALAVER